MKILLTTDGSRYALAAARAVAGWIPALDGTVDVLAVIPRTHTSDNAAVEALRHYSRHGLGAPSGRKRMHSGAPGPRAAALEWRGAAGRWVDGASGLLEARGLRVREIVRTGDPAEVALEQLASQPYDLVVVGAKGRGDAPFFRKGSVAQALLERSGVPVLMVRARSTRRRTPSAEHPLRVVLAVDGGPESEQAADRCARLFGTPMAEARVLAVASGAGGLGRRKASIVARSTAERVRSRGLSAEAEVIEGEPAERIRELAGDADLVVMGGRSAESGGDRPLGSVSLEVASSAPCSVLLVRSGAPAALPRKRRQEAAESMEAAEPSAETFEIAYRSVRPSRRVEERAWRAAVGLRKVAPELIHTRLTIGRSNGRHRKGNLYEVRLDLTVPGRQIEVSRTPPEHREDETVLTAMDEAYEKARRALVETNRKDQRRRATA